MHFTDIEAIDIANQGIEDIFSGTESYASRYMQGMMYANDVMTISQVNGNEGLLGDIASKISQFAKWLWQKIKAVFSWVFGGGTEFKIVVKEGREVIDMYAKDYRLKSDACSKMNSQLLAIAKRFKEGTDAYIKNLTAMKSELENDKLKNIIGANVSEFESKFNTWHTFFEGKAEIVKDAKGVKDWGYAVLDFIEHMSTAQQWFSSNYVCHSATRVKGGTTQSAIDEAIKKDIEKIENKEDQTKASATIFKLANIAVNCANYFNVNITSCNTIIASIKSKSYFDKK